MVVLQFGWKWWLKSFRLGVMIRISTARFEDHLRLQGAEQQDLHICAHVVGEFAEEGAGGGKGPIWSKAKSFAAKGMEGSRPYGRGSVISTQLNSKSNEKMYAPHPVQQALRDSVLNLQPVYRPPRLPVPPGHRQIRGRYSGTVH